MGHLNSTMKLLIAALLVAGASAMSNCALCLHIVETKGEYCNTLTKGANSTADAETAGLCNNMLLAMRNHCPSYEGSCKQFVDTKPMQVRNDYVKGAGWAADYDAGKCPPPSSAPLAPTSAPTCAWTSALMAATSTTICLVLSRLISSTLTPPSCRSKRTPAH